MHARLLSELNGITPASFRELHRVQRGMSTKAGSLPELSSDKMVTAKFNQR